VTSEADVMELLMKRYGTAMTQESSLGISAGERYWSHEIREDICFCQHLFLGKGHEARMLESGWQD